jgi:polypeptide N-acetylgalactosaminyltransferase
MRVAVLLRRGCLPIHPSQCSGLDRNAFNQFISDRLPLDREFGDRREEGCFDQRYYPTELLPTTRSVAASPSSLGRGFLLLAAAHGAAAALASVIIIFHNEAVSALLRTVQSVLTHSPSRLVHEVRASAHPARCAAPPQSLC